jgi:hypothetical protein
MKSKSPKAKGKVWAGTPLEISDGEVEFVESPSNFFFDFEIGT